jgi:hypothetical protein
MPKKNSHKKGGAKKEYTGTLRHFTLHEVDGKSVTIGSVDIKDHQTPLDAAKKLFSCYCRSKDIKPEQRNKVNIKFCIRETTRGHSKVYGPYKGKFVKYDKPLMLKLKTGTTIKIFGKPMVKLSKGNNKNMVGGDNGKIPITEEELRKLVNYLSFPVSRANSNQIMSLNQNGKKNLMNRKKEECNVAKFGTTLSNLDISNITDMSGLFREFDFNRALTRGYNINISGWNVSHVTNMSQMFEKCKGFNQNLSNWKVSKSANDANMFDDMHNVKGGSTKIQKV